MQILKINVLLTALDVSHNEIAETVGVSRQMVSATIKGDRKSRKTQARIVEYLRARITIQSLFEADAEPTKKARPQKRL